MTDEKREYPEVTRFELIDHTVGTTSYSPEVPRSVVAYGVKVEVWLQDQGATMKVHLSHHTPEEEP